MPTKRQATEHDIQMWVRTKKTEKTEEELLKELDKVEVEESLFMDPGPDYSALLLKGERIGYWPGY